MELTETTRELILDKIDKLKRGKDLLELMVNKKQTPEFDDFHQIEIEILESNINILTKTIIKNEYISN